MSKFKNIKSEEYPEHLAKEVNQINLQNKLYNDVLEMERFKTYAHQLINKIHTNKCKLIPHSMTAIKEFGISYGYLSTILFYLEQLANQQKENA